jgi:hypothetical protein
MIYVLIPHVGGSPRYFTTYASAEQAVVSMARALKAHTIDPNWCKLIAYDGLEELSAVFLYTLVGDSYLQRTSL